MAKVSVYTMTITTGNSITSSLDLGQGEWTRIAIAYPQFTSVFSTEAVNGRIMGAATAGGTFYTIGYSNNPATSTSGFQAWEAAKTSGGSMVICEAAPFSPVIKLSFTATATVAAECYVFAGKF